MPCLCGQWQSTHLHRPPPNTNRCRAATTAGSAGAAPQSTLSGERALLRPPFCPSCPAAAGLGCSRMPRGALPLEPAVEQRQSATPKPAAAELLQGWSCATSCVLLSAVSHVSGLEWIPVAGLGLQLQVWMSSASRGLPHMLVDRASFCPTSDSRAAAAGPTLRQDLFEAPGEVFSSSSPAAAGLQMECQQKAVLPTSLWAGQRSASAALPDQQLDGCCHDRTCPRCQVKSACSCRAAAAGAGVSIGTGLPRQRACGQGIPLQGLAGAAAGPLHLYQTPGGVALAFCISTCSVQVPSARLPRALVHTPPWRC